MVHDWCFRRSNRLLVFASGQAGYSDVDCKTGAVPIDIQIGQAFRLDLPFFVKRNFKLFIAGAKCGRASRDVRSWAPKGRRSISHVTFNDGMKWGDLWGDKWPYDSDTDSQREVPDANTPCKPEFEHSTVYLRVRQGSRVSMLASD